MAAPGSLSKSTGEKKTSKVSSFFQGVWAELKKVHWPSKRQIVVYTVIVIVAVLVVSFAMFIVDTLLDIPTNWLINAK